MANSNANTSSPTTQRAYTLRLRGADENDHSWRNALWATHEAVNKGAKVFGDWLLTFRGGLCHKLADTKVSQGKDKPDRDPTDERRDRRILLALSWLSVESECGAPDDANMIVAYGDDCKGGKDNKDSRNRKVVAALCDILKKRQVPDAQIGDPAQKPENQPGTWLGDCAPSLSANIRDDAVWVNRSKAFDKAVAGQDLVKAREDCRILMWSLFTDDYLTPPRKPIKPKKSVEVEGGQEEEPTDESGSEERRAAVVKSGKGAGQRTRHPFSHLFGAGKPFGKPKQSLTLREHWHSFLKPLIDATGIPLRSGITTGSSEGSNPKSGRSQSELHREMFSKAAARLAQIWTKQKQQEGEREERKAADEALKQMEQCSAFVEPLRLLAEFCEQRQASSGALGVFRITSRQIIGWNRIVDSWAPIQAQDGEVAREARVETAKTLQDEDRDKKFGDINLFITIADEHFKPVWFHDGKPDAGLLEKYVKGMRARADAVRLKIASYRHPDPYFNPIFCQFGNSRPAIEFRRLKSFTSEPVGQDSRAVGMLLWNPVKKQADLRVLHAVSRRFDHEIGSACDTAVADATNLPEVTRRSRLGSAAAGLTKATDKLPIVAGVFDRKKITKRAKADSGEEDSPQSGTTERDPEWNGTLSADRRSLADLGKLVEKKADHETVKRRRNQLRWTLIVSLELQQRGPWYDYIANAANQSPFHRTVRKDEDKGQRRKKGTKYVSAEGWPFEELNKPIRSSKDDKSLVADKTAARGFHASLILSRLPGLRVLSVDLGHRYAAACAVWQTLTSEQMNAACKAANHAVPAESNLSIHLSRPTGKIVITGRKKGQKVVETTIYRRIGADHLDDIDQTTGEVRQVPHPAPWARLERQFLIKLPGEDQPARAASNKGDKSEAALVAGFAKRLGLVSGDDRDKGRAVDELMAHTVRVATLGLKRHARRAKIAYALAHKTKAIPGMGGSEKQFQVGDKDHIKFLTDALFDWHALAGESKWDDKAARELWNQHIATLKSGWRVEDPKPHDEAAEKPARQQRRKNDDALRQRLTPIAEQLAGADRSATHAAWKTRWEEDDGQPAVVPRVPTGQKGPAKTTVTKAASRWHGDLRLLTDWIMGWHSPGANGNGWNRNVGGLGLTRIATMKSLYQLHKAFAMRAKPDKPRGAPEKGESNAGIAQSILGAMERMREQRVKQLASRIAGSALGLGGHWKQVERHDGEKRMRLGKDGTPQMKWVWMEEPSAKYPHCHAVVIENLTNYRPDELQTRRENRRLMDWSSSKVRKYLFEACQLHGLHLREVQAGYTSRQDSRTGAPGIRCTDVSVTDFMSKPWWRRQVDIAKEKTGHGKGDAREQYLTDLDAKWSVASDAERKSAPPLRMPVQGGELFVSADPHSPSAKGLQADLNAAANIGLKALLDPDWPGKWWYVPCSTKDGQPSQDKVKGAARINLEETICDPANESSEKNNGNAKKKEIVNVWRDPSAASMVGSWQRTPAYWNMVRSRVVDVLRHVNGLVTPEKNAVESTEVPW